MADPIALEGRSIIVTGAGRGIGRAEALLLAQRGARVCVVDLGSQIDGSPTGEDPAAQTVAEIAAAGGTAIAVRASVADPEGIARIIGETIAAFGGIDAIVNNAGNFGVHTLEEASAPLVQRFLDVHLLGSLELVRAAWPYLRESAAPRVVNTISAAAWGVAGMVPYGAAKGGVVGLTRNLAVEGAEFGIRVNALAPGAGTRMVDATADALPAGFAEKMKATMPPELVAPVAAYLASAECTFSGEVLSTSGGGVSRLVTVRTEGIRNPQLTPEAVRDGIQQIFDLDGAKPFQTNAWQPVHAGTIMHTENAS